MSSRLLILCGALVVLVPLVSAHSAFFHPSMWGFNVTDKDFSYDNRPVAPLRAKTFDEWWFHNHLAFPPHPDDFFELPAGEKATAEIACNKGATSYFASSEGGDIRNPANPNDVCPGSPSLAYHTHGIDDLEGCALAIAYKDNIEDVKPEDFTVFSVNQTCVWTRFTDFEVPERMPECPEGGCICAFFWVHSPKAGGEENYMNGFRCKVTGSNSSVPLAKPQVARRCGSDPENKKQFSVPQNCTYGAKLPFYWMNDDSNMFEDQMTPPVYNDLYNFADGAQTDIFEDSYVNKPEPGVGAPLPVFANIKEGVDHIVKGEFTALNNALIAEGVNVTATMLGSSETTPNPVDDNAGSTMRTQSPRSCHRASAALRRRRISEEDLDPRLLRRYVPRSILRMSHTSRKLHGDTRRLWHMW